MIQTLELSVGKRGLEDSAKLGIQGCLITPSEHVDLGVLFVNGLMGHFEDYIDSFGGPLAQRWPVYITNLRNKGFAFGNRIVEDLVQIDEQIRDRMETDRILYAGHSMGFPLAVEAARRHGREVVGYLGLATYPSYADCLNWYAENSWENPLSALVEMLSHAIRIGPVAYPLKSASIEMPTQFIIPSGDEVTYTCRPTVRRRFEEIFALLSRGNTRVIPGNHCFNQRRWDFAPFNKDKPDVLLREVEKFVERVESHP